nr:unnamed protein product [Callosobruchus analis]
MLGTLKSFLRPTLYSGVIGIALLLKHPEVGVCY